MVGIFTYIARAIYLGRSFDIFIDEVTYLQISRAIGFRQQIDLAGQPFYLHPPAWFIIEGGYIRLLNITGNLIAQIYATRFLVAAFAAVSAVLVFLIARRAAGWPAGFIAAVLFALDPFVIKLNSLNMLETSAMTWALAGYWIIISGLASDDESAPLRRGRDFIHRLLTADTQPIAVWRQLLAGLFFGLALLTKEMLVFVTLLPLAVFFVLNWSLPRRAAAAIGGLAVAVYATYPAWVATTGEWGIFVQEKTHGFVRFAGFVRSTGFKRAGGPSLIQTAVDRLTNYGASYLLFALGFLALYVLLTRPGRINRVIAVWTACTYAMLGYNILFGTLEEQFFYYLIVACVLVDAVAAVWFLSSQAARPAGRAVVNAVVILWMLISGFNGFQWANVHLVPNDGFVKVLDYLHANVPRGQTVASTSETGQYVLQGYLSGPWGAPFTVDDLKKFGPDYLLVTPHTLVWNNSNTAQSLLDWVAQNGQLIYWFDGRESNTLLLYRLPWAKGPLKGAPSSDGAPVPSASGTPTGESLPAGP